MWVSEGVQLLLVGCATDATIGIFTQTMSQALKNAKVQDDTPKPVCGALSFIHYYYGGMPREPMNFCAGTLTSIGAQGT